MSGAAPPRPRGAAPSNGGPPLETISLSVGTAGHIDHGKTELIKFLTGCETDRLPEEKARGMTIDLGFATCVLPNQRRVGIVDVPGHERFIHNMVAGASGIDVVLLVVAADDGVMPQTLEHFHIVRLLGVSAGLIAVTKTDLVSGERVQEVVEQVRELIAGSFLEGCPVVPVSSRTGEGFDVFYDAFVATVDKTAVRNAEGPFLLHVERSFDLKGLGTIISGIPRSGRARIGDSLELLPGGGPHKVRGIQVYGENATEGKAGECVALRLSDLGSTDARRGMVLASPGYFTPVRFLNTRFSLLPGLNKPLKPRTAVRLHVGTADVTGYLVLPELTPLQPGTDRYVQIQLRDPVVAAPGDFFVVRQRSPVRTLGGGYVVSPDHMRMRRSRGDWEAACREREDAFRQPSTALTYVLERAGAQPVALAELARRVLLDVESAALHVEQLVTQGTAVELAGKQYIHTAVVGAARDEILHVLGGFHDAQPLSVGFPKRKLFPQLSAIRTVTDHALTRLLEEGAVAADPAGLHIPERLPKLSARQSAVAEQICDVYRQRGFAAPRRDELPAIVGAPAGILDPIIDHLIQTAELVVVSDKVVLHKDRVEESRRKLTAYLEANGSMESGAFRDMLNTTRKYSIPLLEYWDAQGLTRRVGDARILRNVEE